VITNWYEMPCSKRWAWLYERVTEGIVEPRQVWDKWIAGKAELLARRGLVERRGDCFHRTAKGVRWWARLRKRIAYRKDWGTVVSNGDRFKSFHENGVNQLISEIADGRVRLVWHYWQEPNSMSSSGICVEEIR